MNENITPLPWFAYKDGLIYASTEEGEPCVAVTKHDPKAFYALSLNSDECAANTAYIVDACNAYPALTARVKELEEALQTIKRVGLGSDYSHALECGYLAESALDNKRESAIEEQMEARRPPTLEELEARHKLHDCNRGRCACRCGCETIIGCRVSDDDLCGVCAVRDMRGDDAHGYPVPEAALNKEPTT